MLLFCTTCIKLVYVVFLYYVIKHKKSNSNTLCKNCYWLNVDINREETSALQETTQLKPIDCKRPQLITIRKYLMPY